MRIVIVNSELDERGKRRLVASHGVDHDTGRSFPVQQVHPMELGAIFKVELGEWVLPDA